MFLESSIYNLSNNGCVHIHIYTHTHERIADVIKKRISNSRRKDVQFSNDNSTVWHLCGWAPLQVEERQTKKVELNNLNYNFPNKRL